MKTQWKYYFYCVFFKKIKMKGKKFLKMNLTEYSYLILAVIGCGYFFGKLIGYFLQS